MLCKIWLRDKRGLRDEGSSSSWFALTQIQKLLCCWKINFPSLWQRRSVLSFVKWMQRPWKKPKLKTTREGGGFLFDLLPLNFCQLASKCCQCYDYYEAYNVASGYQKQSWKLLSLLLLSFLSHQYLHSVWKSIISLISYSGLFTIAWTLFTIKGQRYVYHWEKNIWFWKQKIKYPHNC